MSFSDRTTKAIDRAEASLNALLLELLKAKAYREVAAIAAIAEAVAALPGRARDGWKPTTTNTTTASPEVAVGATAQTGKASEPSWMRPKTT
jgi:hypothetical protein